MKVLIATNNAHKADEIANAFSGTGIEFLTLSAAGVSSDPAEDADSFEGNARIKAESARAALGDKALEYAVLADDSGLEVDALDGAPGVYSSRFAGEDADDAANNALLLEKLDDVPDEQRTARFVCTMVLIAPDGSETVSRGAVEGRMGRIAHGSEGFGYDPLFYPDELGGNITFAQVPQTEKNSISHRARALANLRGAMEGLVA